MPARLHDGRPADPDVRHGDILRVLKHHAVDHPTDPWLTAVQIEQVLDWHANTASSSLTVMRREGLVDVKPAPQDHVNLWRARSQLPR